MRVYSLQSTVMMVPLKLMLMFHRCRSCGGLVGEGGLLARALGDLLGPC